MAGTKIFVSSTCFDLSVLRAELRNFIISLGHEPIMSDYADILYDPRTHTHTSCVNEVGNCDLMVVIIGSRFGGTSVPQALEQIDLSKLKELSNGFISDSEDTKISITQLEVLKAIESNIPVYAFIDKKVYYEHEVYEKNKKKNPDIINDIIFPAIEKQDTAQYIFDFINYIRLRTSGNQIFQFERLQDIEDILKKQWSGYFQKLLYEQRTRIENSVQINHLNEKFEDLKTAIITSIQNVDQREVANGIVRYRKLSEFLYGIKCEKNLLCSFKGNMDELLQQKNIVDIRDLDNIVVNNERVIYPRTAFILEDGTFFQSRMSKNFFLSLENDWNDFKLLQKKSKDLILDALREMGRPSMLIRYRDEHIEDYCNNIINQNDNFSEDEI